MYRLIKQDITMPLILGAYGLSIEEYERLSFSQFLSLYKHAVLIKGLGAGTEVFQVMSKQVDKASNIAKQDELVENVARVEMRKRFLPIATRVAEREGRANDLSYITKLSIEMVNKEIQDG